MHLSRLRIDNYGPVRDRDWELDPGMTLFHGANESGKTVLVESIVKLLLGGETGEFAAIDRVAGSPAGFLVVERDAEPVQLPDADYRDLFPAGTTSRDLRNAFVIRDVDLRIPERERDFGRAAYYRDVTDRVLGSQTRRIEAVCDHIAEIGCLANPDSTRLANRQPAKLKDRRDGAADLVDELEAYLESCREEGILAKVGDHRRAEAELERIGTEIAALERAEKRAQLARGRELVAKLEGIEERLEAHAERADEIDEHRGMLSDLESFRASRPDAAIDAGTFGRGAAVAAVLFALSLVAAILSPVTGLGIVAGVLLLVLFYASYRYVDARRHVGARERRIEDANAAGFAGDTLAAVIEAIDREIDEWENVERDRREARSEAIGTLRGLFDANHESVEAWRDEVEAFADSVDPVDRAFDEAELERLQARRDELTATIDRRRTELRRYRERLAELDNDVREVAPGDYLDDVEDVGVSSVEDLEAATRALHRFVDELNDRRDTAIDAISIFDEIADEEAHEINQLFHDDFVVDTFHDVTDGNYTDVRYDGTDPSVVVERADGREVTPFELSQGTYDLLYLTIRLKLAAALAGDEPAFLVLDDAFVHSDAMRTAREVGVLADLVEAGWQVLYFSFRDAVSDAVRGVDGSRVIDLDPLAF